MRFTPLIQPFRAQLAPVSEIFALSPEVIAVVGGDRTPREILEGGIIYSRSQKSLCPRSSTAERSATLSYRVDTVIEEFLEGDLFCPFPSFSLHLRGDFARRRESLDVNASAFSEGSDGLRKRRSIDAHREGEHVSGGPASPAVEELLFRIEVK
jgi:hypothetical protein